MPLRTRYLASAARYKLALGRRISLELGEYMDEVDVLTNICLAAISTISSEAG